MYNIVEHCIAHLSMDIYVNFLIYASIHSYNMHFNNSALKWHIHISISVLDRNEMLHTC